MFLLIVDNGSIKIEMDAPEGFPVPREGEHVSISGSGQSIRGRVVKVSHSINYSGPALKHTVTLYI